MPKRYCGYCLGDVEWSAENVQWQHVTDGERVQDGFFGDMVSARHNQAGTKVIAADVIDDSDADQPITDTAGYLACGCHGSQREHTCEPGTYQDAMRAEGGQDI